MNNKKGTRNDLYNLLKANALSDNPIMEAEDLDDKVEEILDANRRALYNGIAAETGADPAPWGDKEPEEVIAAIYGIIGDSMKAGWLAGFEMATRLWSDR